ncbi:MAG: 30S ribosomal protein S2, small subunit ribosomal protein S2 [Candidatus Peregrinibacteria bacterium GW2011_GWF2_39_17]|nr:MAG: 30S ribosomal protein S2, small subunit ribosomal protein S2 [Candidatus Peregrinibacteria bacterium GW2011_GWF2_39_17]HCW32082.1 30S ribosomal protein S2 [Candidatus Peregrinibacteria bacterium]
MTKLTGDKMLQEMLKNAVHFGHRPSKWNPKMAPYIYGKYSGVHVFDLHKTAEALEQATQFLSRCVKEGKIVLFVSTKQQAVRIVEEVAKECNMPYITHKWVPGLLTNFESIKKRINYLKSLKEQQKNGDFDKYTKKEALELGKTIEKLEAMLGGVQDIKKLPDALFVVDILREKIAVVEAKKLNIPVVGIVDSNVDPTMVTFPIPGNDDAVNSINFLVRTVGDAIKDSKKVA